MASPRATRDISSPTMGQLMGAVAAAGAICALLSSVRSLDDGSQGSILLGVCIVGYTFYLVYLVWLSFAYFTRGQVLALITATTALATLAIEVVVRARSGWIALSAILVLPFLPFGLGALMFRYGGHWVSEPEVEGDSGTLELLVGSKRGRGLTPQPEGPRPDFQPPKPTLSRRRKAIYSIAALVTVVLAVAGGQGLRRWSTLAKLAADHGELEDAYFLKGHALDEAADAALEKDPDSPAVQKRAQEKKITAQEWYRKSDWHGARRQYYESRWW